MRFLVFFFLALVTSHASAEMSCDVDFERGLIVNENQIRVLQKGRTVYQINNKEQLFVEGNLLSLNQEQQEELYYFANGMHYVVPKMVVLATEGVQLAIDTVENVYFGLVGKEHDSYKKLQSAMKRAKGKVKEKFINASGNYYMGPGSLENVDELVDKELEAQIEQAINTSIGGILSAIGGLEAAEGNTDERVQELTERLEQMELQLEREVVPQAETLRQKAKWFCKKLQSLDKIEESLRATVPELKKYNVIRSG